MRHTVLTLMTPGSPLDGNKVRICFCDIESSHSRGALGSFRRSRAANRTGLLDSLVAGPNLFVPLPPFELQPTAVGDHSSVG
jgi:hypothetical protein